MQVDCKRELTDCISQVDDDRGKKEKEVDEEEDDDDDDRRKKEDKDEKEEEERRIISNNDDTSRGETDETRQKQVQFISCCLNSKLTGTKYLSSNRITMSANLSQSTEFEIDKSPRTTGMDNDIKFDPASHQYDSISSEASGSHNGDGDYDDAIGCSSTNESRSMASIETTIESKMKMLVESAESKLMRHKLAPQKSKRAATLLKSPVFAKNTLDEDHLDKLASKSDPGDRDQTIANNKYDEEHLMVPSSEPQALSCTQSVDPFESHHDRKSLILASTEETTWLDRNNRHRPMESDSKRIEKSPRTRRGSTTVASADMMTNRSSNFSIHDDSRTQESPAINELKMPATPTRKEAEWSYLPDSSKFEQKDIPAAAASGAISDLDNLDEADSYESWMRTEMSLEAGMKETLTSSGMSECGEHLSDKTMAMAVPFEQQQHRGPCHPMSHNSGHSKAGVDNFPGSEMMTMQSPRRNREFGYLNGTELSGLDKLNSVDLEEKTTRTEEIATVSSPELSMLTRDFRKFNLDLSPSRVSKAFKLQKRSVGAAGTDSTSTLASESSSASTSTSASSTTTTTTTYSYLQQPLTQRRHSTYMLPIVLDHRRRALLLANGNVSGGGGGGGEDDDMSLGRDSENEAGDSGDSSVSVGTSSEGEEEERDTEEEEGDTTSSASSSRPETARLVSTNLKSQPTKSLPASASSPSALSTPTNESLPAGCGGPCCSHQAELLRMANENAALSRKLFKRPRGNLSQRQRQQQQQLQLQQLQLPQVRPPVKVKDAKCKNTSGSETKRVLGPNRAANNPLERLMIFGAPATKISGQKREQKGATVECNRLSSKRQSAVLLAPDKKQTNKRHSIISIFSNSNNNNYTPCASGDHRLSISQQRAHTDQSSCVYLANRRSRNSLESATSGPFKAMALISRKQHQQQTRQEPKRSQQEAQLQPQQQYEPLIPESGFKIVVMGTSGSGKTSIIQRFLYDSFNKRHQPTVEDTYFVEFPHMKNLINISISDTSGTYQFPAMRKLAINSGDAFILVYSVDDPKSFDDLEQLRQTILDEREQAYLETSASITSNESSSPSSGLGSSSLNNSAASIASYGGIQFGQQSHQNQVSHNHQQTPTTTSNHNPLNYQHQTATTAGDTAQSRHWSLASLFHSNNNNNSNISSNNNNTQQHKQASGTTAATTISQQHRSSMSSSIYSSSSSFSSTDNSRRSSVSAAEAALRTRRTRRPPMVIVANKHDLPEERHLVNSDEIEALAVIDWNNGFVRASAAFNINISEVFQEVLRQARQPPTLTEAIVSKRRKSLPPKLPYKYNNMTNNSNIQQY